MPTKKKTPLSPEKTYSVGQVKRKLAAELPTWTFSGGSLQRIYKTTGWAQTLMLINAIGFLAEAAWHHPDLVVSWAQVVVKLSTHSAKGITDKDFALAKKMEESVLWLPPADSALGGFEKGSKQKWVK